MPIRFPAKRKDGSFEILITLRGMPSIETGRRWLSRWTSRNSVWEHETIVRGNRSTEVVRLADDFFLPLIFEKGPKGHTFIRLLVKPESKLWRDWMILRLLKDLSSEVPGVDVYQFEDHTGANPGRLRKS